MAKAKYSMSEREVEHLARDLSTAQDAVTGGRVTYLRILVTACQAVLGQVKRGKALAADTQLDVLKDVSDRYYAAVLRGVAEGVEDVEGLEPAEATRRSVERNRRSTFARNAKSVLVGWVTTGGDLRSLAAEAVTYDPLRKETRERRGVSESDHGLGRRIRSIVRLAGGSRDVLESAIEELQNALDALSPNGNADVGSITHVMASRPAHARAPRSSVRQ